MKRNREASPLEILVRDEIAAHGPMRFDTFMERALYHPQHGYYASGGVRTGWNGHFLTSPELDPAFGELWATAVEQVWDACDRPAHFELIEVGPGEGSLAATLVHAASTEFREALRVHLVERTDAVRARQEQVLEDLDVSWYRSLDAVPPGPGVVILNEVLDNLPVRTFESDGEYLREVLVSVEDDVLVEVLDVADAGRTHIPSGERVEVRPGVKALVGSAGRILSKGALVVVDYGYRQADAHRYPTGTIVCYSEAGADPFPLLDVGNKDITAHVDWTTLEIDLLRAGFKTWGPETQRELLLRLGAADLDHSLKRRYESAIADGRGADALAAISRRQALRALLDRGGLGSLEVVCGWKEVEPPLYAAQ